MRREPKAGDRVTCLVEQPAYYSGYGGRPAMTFRPGMVGTVRAVTAKVRLQRGPGKDRRPDFLVVDYHAPESGRTETVGLNYCNARVIDDGHEGAADGTGQLPGPAL